MRFALGAVIASTFAGAALGQATYTFSNRCGNSLWTWCCGNGLPCDQGGASSTNWIDFVTCPCHTQPGLGDTLFAHLPVVCNGGECAVLGVTAPFQNIQALRIGVSADFDAPVTNAGIIYGGGAYTYRQPVTAAVSPAGETDFGVGVHEMLSTLTIPVPCVVTGDVRNHLLTTWSGNGVLLVDGAYSPTIPGGVIRNRAGATFLMTGDGTMRGLIGLGYFENAGTMRKNGGAGETRISSRMTNTGLIDAVTGAMVFDGPENHFTGTMAVAPSSSVLLTGTNTGLGSFTTSGGGLVTCSGTFFVESGATATLQHLSLPNTTINGPGTLAVSATAQINRATLDGTGVMSVLSGATATYASDGPILVFNGYTLRNAGTFTAAGGGFGVNTGSTIDNAPGGVFIYQTTAGIGGSFDGSGTFTNRGTFHRGPLPAGTAGIDIPFQNSGRLELEGFMGFSLFSQTAAGVVDLQGGGVSTSSHNPFILNAGRMVGDGEARFGLNNTGGTVAPGHSAGTIRVTGAGQGIFIQAPIGTVEIEVGGVAPGTAHDQIVADAALVLDGTLRVTLINGFVPSAGQTFTVLSASARFGEFATVDLPPGMIVQYTSTAVLLAFNGGPTCDPDFNCDGNADQDDVACIIDAIAGNPGCECQDPDFNQDGNADQDDVAALINVVAGGNCP